MKLRLVEDEIELVESIKSYLKNEGYLIDNTLTFLEAIEYTNLYKYDCALVDIMLPDVAGSKFDHNSKDITVVAAKN